MKEESTEWRTKRYLLFWHCRLRFKASVSDDFDSSCIYCTASFDFDWTSFEVVLQTYSILDHIFCRPHLTFILNTLRPRRCSESIWTLTQKNVTNWEFLHSDFHCQRSTVLLCLLLLSDTPVDVQRKWRSIVSGRRGLWRSPSSYSGAVTVIAASPRQTMIRDDGIGETNLHRAVLCRPCDINCCWKASKTANKNIFCS